MKKYRSLQDKVNRINNTMFILVALTQSGKATLLKSLCGAERKYADLAESLLCAVWRMKSRCYFCSFIPTGAD